MKKITIRLLTENDWKELQQLGRQTFAETFSDSNSEENMKEYLQESFSEEKLRNELVDENSQYYFAEDNGKSVGYLKINFADSQTENIDNQSVEIERIYVLQSHHGSGVGQKLLNKAIEIACEYKANWLWLGVWERNPKAIRFYEKNGFEIFGQHVFVLGNDEQTDIMMRCRPDINLQKKIQSKE